MTKKISNLDKQKTMNTHTKKHLITGLIIFLVVVNIAALSTIIYRNRTTPTINDDYIQLRQRVEEQGMYRFFRDELQLTPDQFNQFRDINHQNMIKSREIAKQLQIKRVEMIDEVSKENPDKEKLDKIANDIGSLHYKLKRNTYNHFLELKDICNEEQQEKLQRMFMRMIDDQGFGPQRRRMNKRPERRAREGGKRFQ